MQTALQYCRGRRRMLEMKEGLVVGIKNNVMIFLCIPEMNPRRPPQAYLIFEGSEPLTFTNVFPRWERSRGAPTQVQTPCGYIM